jgi:3-deoxy-D-manno-octulosonic-acid transferase
VCPICPLWKHGGLLAIPRRLGIHASHRNQPMDPRGEPPGFREPRIPEPPSIRRVDPFWWTYLGLVIGTAPLWMAPVLLRVLRTPGPGGPWERIGLGSRLEPRRPATVQPTSDPQPGRCWFHGASVGEIQVLEPVIHALRQRAPGLEVAVTAASAAGRTRAAELLSDIGDVRFAPVDLPWTVEVTLGRISPSLLVLSESELWPSMLHQAARRGPVVLINARISDRTFRRAERLRTPYRWMLGHLAAAGTQTQEDADRLVALGMEPARIRVTGNTKFDRDTANLEPGERRRWRRLFGFGDDPVLVAGSTFPGEESILIEALQIVRGRVPTARLVLAPRQTDRAESVAQLVRENGLVVERRTRMGTPPESGDRAGETDGGPDVVVLDTVGELARLYAVGELAFVGRSLSAGGGQNPLEPLAAGIPVLHGPRMENFRHMVAVAHSVGAGRTVRTATELGEAWLELLLHPGLRRELGDKGRQLVHRNRGASTRSAELILATLGLWRH